MTFDVGECEDQCEFPEILVGDDAPAALEPGWKILAPCHRCGTPPIEFLTWAEQTIDATQRALGALMVHRDLLLFHWAPKARRKQITHYGLRPAMRPTTHATPAWRAPYICLGDTPSWAWALSGQQRSAPRGEWDLWQTWSSSVTEPSVMAGDCINGIHEVRTHHRIFKRDLWLVGSRSKP